MNNQIDATEIKILDTRSLPDKKGKIYAIIILVMIALGSLFALSLDTRFVYLLVYLWFGTIYGLLLQYGRFCMASAVRDLFAVGVPRMAVGVMIAVALYSLTAASTRLARHHRRCIVRVWHCFHWRLCVGLTVQEWRR